MPYKPPVSQQFNPMLPIAIAAAAIIGGGLYAGYSLNQPAPKPPQESWPGGPKTYAEALAVYNAELDILTRLRLSRQLIADGGQPRQGRSPDY